MSEIKKIKDYECETIDPVTGGKWIVTATHPLSDYGVMLAITDRLFAEDIRPKKDSFVRIIFSLKVEDK